MVLIIFHFFQIRHQIDEQLRNVGQSNNPSLDQGGQKSVEWETQVFNRSKTQEEYVKLVATLIMKLRDYKAKVKLLVKVLLEKFNFERSRIKNQSLIRL